MFELAAETTYLGDELLKSKKTIVRSAKWSLSFKLYVECMLNNVLSCDTGTIISNFVKGIDMMNSEKFIFVLNNNLAHELILNIFNFFY
ncbi:hypothetical protein THOM_1311 [Trachipleistophora hominis]|uniref:Uncharacterized protein n=1 Tax=Trachipleistophora hominis TaxID=72359 RepID=L7JYC8_TRAHO|nr:hypothetical protein THOM_1311 [Trachipleistophora hominis]